MLDGTAGIRAKAVEGTGVRDCVVGTMIFVIWAEIGVQTIGEIIAFVREMFEEWVGLHRVPAEVITCRDTPLKALERT